MDHHPDQDGQAHAPARAAAEAVRATVAAKLLAAWLANRRQTLMPHTLNFRTLAAPEVALLIEMMAAAAQADGPPGEAAHAQAALALALVHADAREAAAHAAALAEPQPLSRILGDVRRARVGAHAYAGALLSVDRASPVAAAFLGYVAVSLALPPDLAHALESRYRV